MTIYSKIRLFTHQFVPKAEVKNIGRVRNELTFRPRYAENPVAIPVYKETQDWFGFPLHYMQLRSRKLSDERSEGHRIGIRFTKSFRKEQLPLIARFDEELSKGRRGFIIEAKAAFGKTACMIYCISRVDRTALVVVPKSDIIDQWVERILFFSDIKRKDIGTVQGRNASWQGKKIVVALVKSLTLGYLGMDFKRYFGQVWYDEVHASTPPRTFAPISCMFPAAYRGGASATPERFDDMHRVFEAHIQEVRLIGFDKKPLKSDILMVDFPESSGEIPFWFRGMQRRGVLISLLADNMKRNLFIASYIRLIWKSKRRQVILSDRIDQLNKLRRIAINQGIPGEETGLYIGKQSISKLKQIARVCTVIYATHKMLDMATDIPELEALVYATPRIDPRQSQGRIERKLVGKKTPIVVDICDPKHKEARRWEAERFKQYTKAGCKVKRIY